MMAVEPHPYNSETTWRLPWYQRAILAAMGGGLITLLATAATLTPSPKGFGTHQQLGLAPCSFTQIVGFRCPSCGMTTSWSHAVRGRLPSAVQSNSGGTMLALMAMLLGPWLLISAVIGRWFVRRPNEWVALGLAVTVVTVTLIDWFIRLNLPG